VCRPSGLQGGFHSGFLNPPNQKGDSTALPYPKRHAGGLNHMNAVTPTEPVYLRTGAIRLVERHGDFGVGTEGYLIGKFARQSTTYLVSLGGSVVEVRDDEIVSAAA